MELPNNPTTSQIIDQSAKIGLSAMEYMLKLQSIEQKSELTSHIKSVNKGLTLLNKDWNPETAELVQDNLSTLKEYSEDSMYSESIQSTLLTNWEYGTTAYNLLEERERMVVDANQQVTSLYDQWSVLKRSEQSEAFTELLDKTSQNKVQVITNANDRAVGRISDDLKDLQDHLNAQNLAKKIDYDHEREGLQVNLNDMNAGHIKNIALDLGFEQQETVGGVETYQVPKDGYITEGGYKKAGEEYEQIVANLGAMSEGQLDILATENPRVMKAIVETVLGKRSATDIKDLGFGPDQADKVAELMDGHIKNIKAFNFQDKLSDWYKTAQTEIETGITELVELDSDVIKARLNGLSDEAILYLNEKAYGVPSGTDYSNINPVTQKNLDDFAGSIILDDEGRDELAKLVATSRATIRSLAIEIDKDGIETLSGSEPMGFQYVQALVNNDTASAEASLASYPSYFTEDKQIELMQFADTIGNSKDLLAKFTDVSGDMKTEALAIKSFQDRWREAGHILPSQAEIEMYQVSAKNATGAWDQELSMLTQLRRQSLALVKLNMPTALKETLPEVVMRAANNVAYNAKQLIGTEWWNDNLPQYQIMNKFKENYDSIPDRVQALAAMADYFTQSDGKGGYMPATTVDNIGDMTHDDAEGKLFLDLMVAYRTLKALDPSLTKIK